MVLSAALASRLSNKRVERTSKPIRLIRPKLDDIYPKTRGISASLASRLVDKRGVQVAKVTDPLRPKLANSFKPKAIEFSKPKIANSFRHKPFEFSKTKQGNSLRHKPFEFAKTNLAIPKTSPQSMRLKPVQYSNPEPIETMYDYDLHRENGKGIELSSHVDKISFQKNNERDNSVEFIKSCITGIIHWENDEILKIDNVDINKCYSERFNAEKYVNREKCNNIHLNSYLLFKFCYDIFKLSLEREIDFKTVEPEIKPSFDLIHTLSRHQTDMFFNMFETNCVSTKFTDLFDKVLCENVLLILAETLHLKSKQLFDFDTKYLFEFCVNKMCSFLENLTRTNGDMIPTIEINSVFLEDVHQIKFELLNKYNSFRLKL